jgi:N-acetylglucosaminyl-diphospho-decaprenol L-rhamnosyltransferase
LDLVHRLDLAVIIVTWNIREVVLNALRTLHADLEQSGLSSTVIVVDNGSQDGTPDAIRAAFPRVQVIDTGANLGFAAGNNVGLHKLGFADTPTSSPNAPRAVFLLNPDTLVQSGAIRALYDALFTLPNAGVCGAQLSYENGDFQHGAFHFPTLAQILIDLFPIPARIHGRLYESAINGRYPRAAYEAGKPFAVDHVLGATMMMRREVIEQTGMFDEQFFMYCEEVDWQMRIREAGFEIYAVPAAHITHLEGRSTGQIKPRSINNLWTSRLLLFRKHFSPLQLHVTKWLVRTGMRIKMRSTDNPELIAAYKGIIEQYH